MLPGPDHAYGHEPLVGRAGPAICIAQAERAALDPQEGRIPDTAHREGPEVGAPEDPGLFLVNSPGTACAFSSGIS